MADTVKTIVIEDTPDRYVVNLMNISDGTGESAVKKVDKSTILSAAGIEPVRLDIEWIRWAIQGFTSVRLYWDHTTDDLAKVLSGNGYEEYPANRTLKDPASAGDTGDILLTTAGASSGATYDITISLRKSR